MFLKTRFSLYAPQDENFSRIVGGQKIKNFEKIKKKKKILGSSALYVISNGLSYPLGI